MGEENTKGITVKELREYLNKLPEQYDDCGMVNGEVIGVEDYYVRVDRPVIHLEIDETTREFLLLHQSQEELGEILKQIKLETEHPTDGDSATN